MTGLVEFLTARLDEDEQAAQLAKARSTGRWYVYDDGVVAEWDGEDAGDGTPRVPNRHTGYFLMYDADRALAEVAAKRAILAEHRPVRFTDVTLDLVDVEVCRCCHSHLDYPDDWDEERAEGWTYPLVQDAFPCVTVRALAAPYVDHPDFDESWRVAAIGRDRETT